jgi:hypothetical protein
MRRCNHGRYVEKIRHEIEAEANANAKADEEPDQLPEFLGVDSEWNQKKEVKSRLQKRAKMRIHEDCDVEANIPGTM